MTNVMISADQWSVLAGMLSVRASGAALKLDVSAGSPTSSDIFDDLGNLTGSLSCAPDPNPGAIWTSNGSGLTLHYQSVAFAEAESDLHNLKMRLRSLPVSAGTSKRWHRRVIMRR